jgi:hypothetical protein
MPIIRLTLVCLALLAGVIFVINAAYMLVSPRAWFALPSWLRATGSLPQGRYTSGWGAVQVRIGGAVFLAGLVWVLYDVYLSRL